MPIILSQPPSFFPLIPLVTICNWTLICELIYSICTITTCQTAGRGRLHEQCSSRLALHALHRAPSQGHGRHPWKYMKSKDLLVPAILGAVHSPGIGLMKVKYFQLVFVWLLFLEDHFTNRSDPFWMTLEGGQNLVKGLRYIDPPQQDVLHKSGSANGGLRAKAERKT